MKKNEKGQTLVSLLFFMIIAITVTSAAVVMIIVNSQATSIIHRGDYALRIAESGVENAILQLLRNPSYSGETFSVGNGTVNVSVVGTNPITITSKGTHAGVVRVLEVNLNNVNNILSIVSWREPY